MPRPPVVTITEQIRSNPYWRVGDRKTSSDLPGYNVQIYDIDCFLTGYKIIDIVETFLGKPYCVELPTYNPKTFTWSIWIHERQCSTGSPVELLSGYIQAEAVRDPRIRRSPRLAIKALRNP